MAGSCPDVRVQAQKAGWWAQTSVLENAPTSHRGTYQCSLLLELPECWATRNCSINHGSILWVTVTQCGSCEVAPCADLGEFQACCLVMRSKLSGSRCDPGGRAAVSVWERAGSGPPEHSDRATMWASVESSDSGGFQLSVQFLLL
jgi:hypothetical protein